MNTTIAAAKALAFAALNVKGGVRKSSTLAFIFWTLRDMGIEPLVVALDTNPAFRNMITIPGYPTPEIYNWDLNKIEDAKNMLPDLVTLAKATGRPLLIDLPARGGESLGVYTLMRSGALRHVDIIGIAPVTQDNLSVIGVIEAHDIIKPRWWIQVGFGSRSSPRPETEFTEKLAKLLPDAKILLEELDESEARELSKTPPVPYEELEQYADSAGINACQWYVISEYWQKSKPIILEAIRKVAPQLFESPATEPADSQDEATRLAREEAASGTGSKPSKAAKSLS
jgi:hypothetical protein